MSTKSSASKQPTAEVPTSEDFSEIARNLTMRSLRDRYEMFLKLTELSPDSIQAFRAGLREFVDEEDLETVRRMEDDELAALYFLDKTYHFVYYSWEWKRVMGGSQPFDIELDLWIQQLGTYPGFRPVHLRQGMYYRDFARYVNRVLLTAGRTLEEEVRRCHESADNLRVPQETLRRYESDLERQLKDARFMMETALFQVVDGLYWAHWSRRLAPQQKERLQAVFAVHGHQLIPISRSEFRRILRGEIEFLAAEIEAGEEELTSAPG